MPNPSERLDGAVISAADTASCLRNDFLESGPGSELAFTKNVSPNIMGGGVLDFNNFKDPFKEMADPFRQDYENPQGFGKLWQGIKKLFSHEDNLDDTVKKHVEDTKLNPNEQTQLKKEEELYKQEMQKVFSEMTLACLDGGHTKYPDVEHDPRFATMHKRDLLVKREEDSIRQEVEKQLGPKVMGDVKTASGKYDETYQIKNPMGTGEGMRPHIPDPVLEYYWQTVRDAVHKRVAGADTKQ